LEKVDKAVENTDKEEKVEKEPDSLDAEHGGRKRYDRRRCLWTTCWRDHPTVSTET